MIEEARAWVRIWWGWTRLGRPFLGPSVVAGLVGWGCELFLSEGKEEGAFIALVLG
jgi:hypothetical protein